MNTLAYATAAVFAGLLFAASNANANAFWKIETGRYLAHAGDCAACHTAENGKPYAGGRPVPTPFGTIYSTNITPDKDTGIGKWSDEDFYNAMHAGIGPDGRHYYPAFPYPWFTKATRADVMAIKAFLDTLEPVRQENKPSELPWPLSWRGGMPLWNALFFKEGTFKSDSGKSADWNRGAYLVEGFSHCGACHTPKNALGGLERSHRFNGGFGEHWYAPNLGANERDGLGKWSMSDIVEYLKTGASASIAAAGPMGEVVEHSTQHLNDADLRAIATYLKGIPGEKEAQGEHKVDQRILAHGEAIYTDQCAGCHMRNGEGIAHVFPVLKGTSAIQAKDPSTLIRVILSGARMVPTSTKPTGFAMPGFAEKLRDQDIADLVTYIRNAWGNSAPAVSEGDVSKIRKQVHESQASTR
jgi:mono/diheme cytochrome c family protein